ncbi:unnamed protein product [Danaus chrysippus]|uniref:(African queen) hypothetical protein n=1 Tax=Danaus chrysippus TaxID=151541 RepID=A0A8J2QUD3_9NEOP|nr:unnamed protein product [Danaus chrysippus]
MHFKLIVLLSLVSFVRNHDVYIGSEGGRKIFEDTRYAGPAIWRQVENITVIAPENEVISMVNITDLRPDKDGDVEIVDGGKGEKSVTIEIKSPTVLRGYEFHIEVYSTSAKTDNNNAQSDSMENDFKTTAIPENVSGSSEVIPAEVGKDSDMPRPAREASVEQEESGTTEVVNESTTEYTTTTDSTTEDSESSVDEDSVPVDLDSDLLRPARHASEEESIEDITTTTEMEHFEFKGTLEYIPTTEETGSENNPTIISEDVIRPARRTDEENDSDATTEIVEEQNIDTTPNNGINKNNYTYMDILEYIKMREQSVRQIRRTDEDSEESKENSSESSANDETVDLVPPEENSSYSDNFYTDSTETTINSEETTPISNPRYVRRLDSDLMLDTTTETNENTDVTEGSTIADEVTTEAIENTRNSRNTENLLDSEDLDLNNETSAENNMMSNDKISSGIVLLKGNDIIVSAEGKELRFNLPIVLIIGNENNFPLFNMIGPQDTENRILNNDLENMNDNLDVNVPEYTSVDAEAASEIIMNDDSY